MFVQKILGTNPINQAQKERQGVILQLKNNVLIVCYIGDCRDNCAQLVI